MRTRGLPCIRAARGVRMAVRYDRGGRCQKLRAASSSDNAPAASEAEAGEQIVDLRLVLHHIRLAFRILRCARFTPPSRSSGLKP